MDFESEVDACELEEAMKESKRLDPEDNTNYVKELRDQLADMFTEHDGSIRVAISYTSV